MICSLLAAAQQYRNGERFQRVDMVDGGSRRLVAPEHNELSNRKSLTLSRHGKWLLLAGVHLFFRQPVPR